MRVVGWRKPSLMLSFIVIYYYFVLNKFFSSGVGTRSVALFFVNNQNSCLCMQISSKYIHVALFVQWLGPCIVVAETVVRFYDKAKSSFCHLPSLGLNYSRRTHTSFLTSHLFGVSLFNIFRRRQKINTHTTVVVDEDERRPRTLDSTDTDTSTRESLLAYTCSTV